MKKTQRSKHIFLYNKRSKFICHGRYIDSVGNHFVRRYIRGVAHDVKKSLAYLHHYRSCPFETGCDKQQSVKDKSVFKYKDLLEENAKDNIEYVKSYCMR